MFCASPKASSSFPFDAICNLQSVGKEPHIASDWFDSSVLFSAFGSIYDSEREKMSHVFHKWP